MRPVFPSELTAGLPTEYPVEKVPLQRQGTFEEMAGTFLYMVGKSGAYLNSSVQFVDGGRLSVHPANV
jgi:THO complex subunit 3